MKAYALVRVTRWHLEECSRVPEKFTCALSHGQLSNGQSEYFLFRTHSTTSFKVLQWQIRSFLGVFYAASPRPSLLSKKKGFKRDFQRPIEFTGFGAPWGLLTSIMGSYMWFDLEKMWAFFIFRYFQEVWTTLQWYFAAADQHQKSHFTNAFSAKIGGF